MIAKAILKINPNAIFVVKGNDINTCEIEWLENTTPISKDNIKTQISIIETEIANEQQIQIDNKASAKSKLEALGLTTEEINALIGQ